MVPVMLAYDVARDVARDVAGTGPAVVLRAFWQREEDLIEAGDIAGAVELNVATWLGPEASGPVSRGRPAEAAAG